MSRAGSHGVPGRSGRYLLVQRDPEPVWAFHPAPLPPDPPLAPDGRRDELLEQADQSLGRLDGLAQILPNVDVIIRGFVRKEAVLSSQIEGTQSSLSDLLLFEQDQYSDVPEDVHEPSDYIAAMQLGLDMLGELPLCIRVIREVHARLLSTGRGSDKDPGEFRRTQNWIGGTRPGDALFVPPPAHEVPAAMGALERFLHDDPVRTPTLIKAALAHVQFETIHPFLDGNGRVGRMLVPLLLCERRVLHRPLLYLSLYLKEHRTAYYEHLQRVRDEGAWEPWVQFFLEGVLAVTEQTTAIVRRLVRTFDEDRARVSGLGRAASSVAAVYEFAVEAVVFSTAAARRALGPPAMSNPTLYRSIGELQRLGILDEISGRSRDRVYAHARCLQLLDAGIDLDDDPGD